MSVAFDNVCYKALLRKLDHYGLHGPVNKLLDSYFLRLQFLSFFWGSPDFCEQN